MRRFTRAALMVSCFILLSGCATDRASWYYDDEIGEGGPPEAGENGLAEPFENGDGNGLAPVGHLTYQPPIGPFSISIDTDLRIRVTASAQVVTPFGVLKAGLGQALNPDSFTGKDGKPLPPTPMDVTDLIICVRGGGPESCQGHTVRTGRKLKVEIDGRSTQFIETGRVVIEVAPRTAVHVSDDGPSTKTGPPGRARIGIEQFKFYERGTDTEVDLERGHARTKPDLAYNHITGELKTINGASISRLAHFNGNSLWGGNLTEADLPSEFECQQAGDWHAGFRPEEFQGDLTLACIKTAENDLGYVVVGRVPDRKPTAYRVYTYTWVR